MVDGISNNQPIDDSYTTSNLQGQNQIAPSETLSITQAGIAGIPSVIVQSDGTAISVGVYSSGSSAPKLVQPDGKLAGEWANQIQTNPLMNNEMVGFFSFMMNSPSLQDQFPQTQEDVSQKESNEESSSSDGSIAGSTDSPSKVPVGLRKRGAGGNGEGDQQGTAGGEQTTLAEEGSPLLINGENVLNTQGVQGNRMISDVAANETVQSTKNVNETNQAERVSSVKNPYMFPGALAFIFVVLNSVLGRLFQDIVEKEKDLSIKLLQLSLDNAQTMKELTIQKAKFQAAMEFAQAALACATVAMSIGGLAKIRSASKETKKEMKAELEDINQKIKEINRGKTAAGDVKDEGRVGADDAKVDKDLTPKEQRMLDNLEAKKADMETLQYQNKVKVEKFQEKTQAYQNYVKPMVEGFMQLVTHSFRGWAQIAEGETEGLLKQIELLNQNVMSLLSKVGDDLAKASQSLEEASNLLRNISQANTAQSNISLRG